MCARYHHEIEEIKRMVDFQPLGILNLMFDEFKSTALPEPVRLLGVIDLALPA